MLKVLQQTPLPYMEWEISEVQAGFWKGRGTQDHITNIHWLLECTKEFQKMISLCFIARGKVFDYVAHEKRKVTYL